MGDVAAAAETSSGRQSVGDPDGQHGGGWQVPSRRYVSARVVTALLVTPVPVGVAVFLAVRFSPWWWLLAVPFAIGLLWVLTFSRAYVRALGYREQQQELVVREGLVNRSVVLVPYGRLQQVTLQEGFVDARLGIAKVVVRTAAGSDVIVPGLDVAAARDLRTRLARRTRGRDDGL